MKHGEFRIRPMTAVERGQRYQRFQVVGYLGAERIRKRFPSREEAAAEKVRLEVLAANTGEITPVNTRLSHRQVAEAETAFARLNGASLLGAVDWYLANYRAPVVSQELPPAVAAYVAAKRPLVSEVHLDDVKRKLKLLQEWFPASEVGAILGPELEARMQKRNWAPKTWNNVRGCFHDFFAFCAGDSRRWCTVNPAAGIAGRRVPRGIPTIETAERIGELFKYLEDYSGGQRRRHRPGFLIPYFALATFAGLRPSIPDGEIWKIGQLSKAELARTIDIAVGVIRISPAIAKTNNVRQVKIQPVLAAWLAKYPPEEFPIIMPNLQAQVTAVRTKFGLADDVLRHTWISMHVAQFKSIGEAALEAGNSETIIRRHYLNMVTPGEAEAFHAIRPS